MEHVIMVSEQLYAALQRQAERSHQSLDALVEGWLRQRLDLERYPELEWRQGAGGRRVGIKGTTIDVYTVAGYSLAGYIPQEIAGELVPLLSLEQVHAALRYYAEYPDEIDQVLAESEPDSVAARLYRTLGSAGHRQLTGAAQPPRAVREGRAGYQGGGDRSEHD